MWKKYLIAFGSKNDYKFVQIIIKQSSFWHLLGCVLEADNNEGKNDTYNKCKNKINVAEKISSVHSFSEIKENIHLEILKYLPVEIKTFTKI